MTLTTHDLDELMITITHIKKETYDIKWNVLNFKKQY
jgi:hypothetical protein